MVMVQKVISTTLLMVWINHQLIVHKLRSKQSKNVLHQQIYKEKKVQHRDKQ
jgi:hypothetical protein